MHCLLPETTIPKGMHSLTTSFLPRVELRCEVYAACGGLWQQSSGSSEEAIRFPLDSCDSQSVKVKKQMHGSDVIGLQWHVGLGFLIMVVKAVMVVTRS